MVETDTKNDVITNPSHYDQASVIVKIQPIDMIRLLSFEVGSVFKYLYRYPFKGKPVEDLRKARQYLYWSIERHANFTDDLTVNDKHIIEVLQSACKDEMLLEMFKIFRFEGEFNRFGRLYAEQIEVLKNVVSMVTCKIAELENDNE